MVLLLSILLLVGGGNVIIYNWYCVLLFLLKRRHSSWIPLLGGLSCCLGCYLSPCEAISSYYLLPVILDWEAPGLLFTCIFVFVPPTTRGMTGRKGDITAYRGTERGTLVL